jgi:hypothetical protein
MVLKVGMMMLEGGDEDAGIGLEAGGAPGIQMWHGVARRGGWPFMVGDGRCESKRGVLGMWSWDGWLVSIGISAVAAIFSRLEFLLGDLLDGRLEGGRLKT